jgi:hypothetical protein
VPDLYLDHDVSARVAVLLQATGLDVPTAYNTGAAQAHDGEQLWLSTNMWSAPIITHNGKDFRLLHQAWQLWARVWAVSQEHAGILVLPHAPPAQSVQRLREFLNTGRTVRNTLYFYRPPRGWERFA